MLPPPINQPILNPLTSPSYLSHLPTNLLFHPHHSVQPFAHQRPLAESPTDFPIVLLHHRAWSHFLNKTYPALLHVRHVQFPDQWRRSIRHHLSIRRHSAPIYVEAGHLKPKIPLGQRKRNTCGSGTFLQSSDTLYTNRSLSSAKSLAESPTIQRRPQHIQVLKHANRQAVQDGVIRIIHQLTSHQREDIATKAVDHCHHLIYQYF